MNSKKTFGLLSFLLLLIPLLTFIFPINVAQASQIPETDWGKTYNAESGSSIIQTADSGYIVLGTLAIYSANEKAALLKIDSSGNQVWLRTLPFSDQKMLLAKSVSGTFGVATTVYRQISYNEGTYQTGNLYLTSLDSNGNQLWNRTYLEITQSISLESIVSLGDGGFILAGDAFLLRVDNSGNSLWNRTYGGTEDDTIRSIVQTIDGGFMLVVSSYSFMDNLSILLVKIDGNGVVQWTVPYTNFDLSLPYANLYPAGAIGTKDGGVLIFGSASSYTNNGYQSSGCYFKVDSEGNIQWTKTNPGFVNYAAQTKDGGYAFATDGLGGTTQLMRTDGLGNIQWNNTYPASTDHMGYALIPSSDGGLVFTGKSSNRMWILKTAPIQNVPAVQLPAPVHYRAANASLIWQQYFDGLSGFSIVQTSDGGFVIIGENAILQNSFLGPEYVNYSSLLLKTNSEGNLVFKRALSIGEMFDQDNSSYSNIIQSVDVVMKFIVQTTDGGYAVAGTTTLHRNSGAYSNYCMAKTDSEGDLQWVKQYDFRDGLDSFAQAIDGGYFLAGNSGYYPSSVSHLIKTDAQGAVQWNTNLAVDNQIIPTQDGGCTVFGSKYAYSSGSYSGASMIIHLNSQGIVTWSNSFSGFAPMTGAQTNDGGYFVAGRSDPYTYLSPTVVLRLDDLGNLSWYKLYDAQQFYYPVSLIASREGGYLFAATTSDFRCLVKVDQNGNIEKLVTLDTLWKRSSENNMKILQIQDGNYVFTGQYIELNTTEKDLIWLAKTSLQTITPNTSPTINEVTVKTAIITVVLVSIVSVLLGTRRKRHLAIRLT
jgi:hypothetical protein